MKVLCLLMSVSMVLITINLVGCKPKASQPDLQSQPAAVEPSSPPEALTEALASVERLTQENDALQTTLGEAVETLQSISDELNDTLQRQMTLEQALQAAQQERDQAVTRSQEAGKTAGQLQGFLKESERRVQELEHINQALQRTVEELADQVNELASREVMPTSTEGDPNTV